MWFVFSGKTLECIPCGVHTLSIITGSWEKCQRTISAQTLSILGQAGNSKKPTVAQTRERQAEHSSTQPGKHKGGLLWRSNMSVHQIWTAVPEDDADARPARLHLDEATAARVRRLQQWAAGGPAPPSLLKVCCCSTNDRQCRLISTQRNSIRQGIAPPAQGEHHTKRELLDVHAIVRHDSKLLSLSIAFEAAR